MRILGAKCLINEQEEDGYKPDREEPTIVREDWEGDEPEFEQEVVPEV